MDTAGPGNAESTTKSEETKPVRAKPTVEAEKSKCAGCRTEEVKSKCVASKMKSAKSMCPKDWVNKKRPGATRSMTSKAKSSWTKLLAGEEGPR